MRRVLEGRWDCSQCGQTGIPGRAKACTGCGDPRNPVEDPSEEPYLTADAADITGTALAAELGEQPDWVCDHCGQANHSDAVSCRGCGQAHDTPDRDAPRRVWAGIRDTIPKPLAAAARGTAAGTRTVASTVRRTPRRTLAAAGGAAVLLLAVVVWGVWAMFFATRSVEVTAVDVSWTRGVEVEEFRTLTREDFDPPADARVHDSWEDVHHYRQVLDHYRTEHYTEQVPYTDTETHTDCQTVSNGNGTFTQSCQPVTRSVTRYRSESRTRDVPVYRDEPVYRTKYRYEVDRWVTDFWHTVSDDDSGVPFWPDVVPGSTEPGHRVGDERREDYTVAFDLDGEEFTESVDLDTWLTVDEGERLTVEVNRQGKVKSVDWAAAA